MKSSIKKIALSVLSVLFITTAVSAQEKVIRLTGAKFAYPIIEKWAAEYKKENPLANIRFETAKESVASIEFQVVAHQPQENELNDKQVIAVGRYALIPVTNSNNPLLSEAKKGINKKDLKNLLFEKSLDDEDAFEEEDSNKKDKYNATVYARDSKSSTAIALADYFDQTAEQIKGKKIIGDDIYLLNAIKKDVNGLTFNSLNYVFDIETRKLKSDISILPLKIKSQQQEILNSQDIDKTISLLEETSIETIPVEKFGFIIPSNQANDREVVSFITWILNNGQKFNHELGFLKLDNNSLAVQKAQFKGEYFSLK
ncbi:hypothetical protein [Viscerimonas tarda]